MDRVVSELSDNDETGTTSMISSLLGDETSRYISETAYQPVLPEIPETQSSRRSLYAYTGPGKMIDASHPSESRISMDNAPGANKIKALLGSIEKLKTSSLQSLKGSHSHINSRSNAAISTVINALHTHDQTLKSLKNALNDIEVITEESKMERNGPSKFSLSSLRQVNRSQKVLNKKDADPKMTKEWVQNEVEIQIEYLRKSLNIDQMQKVLLNVNKEKNEEKEYRSQINELIKHEVNDQVEEIRDSNQNLQVLDQVEDLVSRKINQMQTEILNDLQPRLGLISQDETDKIMSTVIDKTPEYVTESTLKLAIEEALLSTNNKMNNDDAVIEKMNQLNLKVELLEKSISQTNASKIKSELEVRISKLENLFQKSNDDILQKIIHVENDLGRIFNVLDVNTKTQEHHQSEINKLLNTESHYKEELSSKIVMPEEGPNLQNNSFANPEVDRRMLVLENWLQELATKLSDQSEKADITNQHDGVSDSWLSRVVQLEDRINELQTQLQLPTHDLTEAQKNSFAVIEKKFSQLDKILKDQISEMSTTKDTLSFLSEKSKDQELEISRFSLIQSRLNLIEIELPKRNAEINDSVLTARMNSIIDSRINAETHDESGNQVSYTKLQSDIVAQKLYIDSKLSEYETAIQNYMHKKTSPENFELMNKKLADVSKKVDILNAEAVLSKESAAKLKEDFNDKSITEAFAQSDLWMKVQDQISQLSNAALQLASFESEIQENASQVMSIKKEIDFLKKRVDKPEKSLMQQQSQQPNLDVHTRLSVITSRIMDVETRSKALDNVNLTDFSQEMQEMKQKLGVFDNMVKSLDEKVLSITKRQTFETETINASHDTWNSAQLKIADIESLVKTDINRIIQKIELDLKYQGESLRTMNNNIKSLQEDKSSVQIEAWISLHISKLRQEFESKFENKVDNDVLEELVKHLATRDELKKVVKKKMNSISERRSNENIRSNDRIKSNILDELDENRNISNIYKKLKKELEAYLSDQMELLETKLQTHESFFTVGVDMEKKDMQSIKKFAETLINDKMKLILNSHASNRARKEGATVSDDEIELLEQKIRREFDEKLFLLCSDLSSCKNMISSQLYEPFHQCAQWIWKSGHLKLGSAVPWNIQTRNTDEENFQWEQDSFNIKVAEAGLYEVTLAFFTKTKPSVQLVVNGESIMSAINSPSYIVHHSSGYVIDGNGKMQEGVVSGLSLVDFLALPSKSTISIHYHGVKKQTLGHGFLGLRKL